jgi:hypothetical protein
LCLQLLRLPRVQFLHRQLAHRLAALPRCAACLDGQVFDIVAACRLCGAREPAMRGLHVAGLGKVERAHIDANGRAGIGCLRDRWQYGETSGDQRVDQGGGHGHILSSIAAARKAGAMKAEVAMIGAPVAPRSEYG